MSKVLVTDTYLTAACDAIRQKLGVSTMYKPSQMAAAIAAIQGADNIQHGDIPAYVKAETLDVIGRVGAVLRSDSIVFMAGSDSHQSDTANVADGNLHATMAMKALAYALPFDFAAFLGDYTAGSSTTTIAEGKGHFESINRTLDEAFAGLPQFRTVGNHDPLGYSYTANGNTALTPAELYEYIGKYNDDGTTVMGSRTYGYCYRDFASKHVRVICLNTAEVAAPTASAENVSDTQKAWFANTLMGTPSGYGIIILSHHPLDWGNIMGTSHVLRAYVEEGSTNIGGTTYNFSGRNNSAWVLTFHGHTHCYKVDYLHWNNGGVGEAYDVKRIATPNMCFARNNEYGGNGAAEYFGVEFGEPGTTYNKTANTASDTAFCVCVINPSEETVHAICYGAGVDRSIFYGDATVAVTGIILSASSGTLNPGGTTTLTATVLPADATDKTVIWTSSNTAVATVSNGTVTAVAVGSATITARTQDGNFTATYSLTVEKAKAGNLRDVIGYTDGKRISTGDGTYRDKSGSMVVEYIKLADYVESNTVVIRTRGVNFKQVSNPYNDNAYVFYNASKGFTASSYMTEGSTTHGNITVSRAFSGTDMTITITGLTAAAVSGGYSYLRLCGLGSGANLDIRISEEFE